MSMTTTTRKPLIAGVLRRELNPGGAARAERREERGFSFAERASVREALADGRDVRERTMDETVDRLLKELTW